MKKNEVPQDGANSTYGGQHKLIYAVDENGDFVGVKSAGWRVEAEATQAALNVIQQHCDNAWLRASGGETAPLEYYMYYRRMDLPLLAQATGFFQWRIRRHFRPRVFQRLSGRLMARYADALGLDPETLGHLPEHAPHRSNPGI